MDTRGIRDLSHFSPERIYFSHEVTLCGPPDGRIA
jgi:hypothetical protein